MKLLIHCHDDFGLATANSLAAIQAGAEAVDVVVNGLGDRGGNAALEQVVLALELIHKIPTGIDLKKIKPLSDHIEKITGYAKPLIKPIVGEYTFLHSPVQHIRNALEGNYQGFEPFPPEIIGAKRKYNFSLDVAYREALEPLLNKYQHKLTAQKTTRIIARLKKESKISGLNKQQIMAIIKEYAEG